LLLDVPVTQIEFPLQQFQHTRLTKGDLWQLIQDLNEKCEARLNDARLRKAFERNYPDVEAEIEKLRGMLAKEQGSQAAPARSTESILTDLLTIQQGMEKQLANLRTAVRRPRTPRRAESRTFTGRVNVSSSTLAGGDDVNRQLGEILRDYRVARGLSQEMLASKANIDRTYIAQLECGLRSPNVNILCRLARALQILPTALISGLVRQIGVRNSNSRVPPRVGISKRHLN
jgi:DNA-binding XRE family transcriptional regulator